MQESQLTFFSTLGAGLFHTERGSESLRCRLKPRGAWRSAWRSYYTRRISGRGIGSIWPQVNLIEDRDQIAVVGLDGLAPSNDPGVSKTDALPRFASRAEAITAVTTTALANGYIFSKEPPPKRPTRS